MENATKALIIAGSILIAILIIIMGVKVVNAPKGTQDELEDTMKITEKAQFNNKFTQYIGTNKSRAQVMSLLNVIIANNSNNKQLVKVNGISDITATNASDPSLSKKMNGIGNGPFNVEINSYTTEGYIEKIKITYKDASGNIQEI